jgi:hypothetical protein
MTHKNLYFRGSRSDRTRSLMDIKQYESLTLPDQPGEAAFEIGLVHTDCLS